MRTITILYCPKTLVKKFVNEIFQLTLFGIDFDFVQISAFGIWKVFNDSSDGHLSDKHFWTPWKK